MTTSYNGWSASPNAHDFGGLDDREVSGAPGVKLAPGVRAGDVATVLFYVAEQFHRYVEPLVPGTCWGYNYRPDTNNPHVLSCHASATAIDLNAPKHPNGVRGTFTAAQVAMIRTVLAACGGVVAWGGDFRGVDDEMHFEIDGDAHAVAAVAARLAGHPAPAPAPAPHWNGHDLTGDGDSLRGEFGDEGTQVEELQHDLNHYAPAYSHLVEDGVYGEQTAHVLDEYAERESHERDTPAADRAGLHDADGRNIGPRLARALHHDGLI